MMEDEYRNTPGWITTISEKDAYCDGVMERNLFVMRQYIKEDGEVNISDKNCKCMLYQSCENDDIEMAKFLLENGAYIAHGTGEFTDEMKACYYAAASSFPEDSLREAIFDDHHSRVEYETTSPY
jgi:hypothetical protein